MNDISELVYQKFKNTLCAYSMLDGVDNIIVGISGGADSVCLMHLLSRLRDEFGFSLTGAHVNHGIRGSEAKRDSDFSADYCSKLGVDFELLNADCPSVAAATGETLEECGRRLRYEFFESLCKEGCCRIATAHNADDNAETVIFNIVRGSALKGAAGIPPVRGNIIRPLIGISRSEIEAYCKENSLAYVTDSTNLSDDYTRNKIRHSVIPVLKQINPAAVEAFSRFSLNVRRDCEYLDGAADKLLDKAKLGEGVYDRNVLCNEDRALVSRFASKAVMLACGMKPDYEKISSLTELFHSGGRQQLFKNCFCTVSDATVSFTDLSGSAVIPVILKPVRVSEIPFSFKFGDFLIKIENYQNNSKKIHHLLLDNLIDCDKINGDIVLRTRLPGDKITLGRRNVTKSLKKLFNEAGIAPDERDSVPVLCDGRGVIWVLGFGADKRCRAASDSENLISVKGEKYDF